MKKLLIFTAWQAGDTLDLSPESNLWYVQRYENYFDEVTHVFLAGKRSQRTVRNGKMSYISLGTGKTKWDLLISPYRLYKFAKEYGPSAYLTYDQVWVFWMVILIKLFTRAKVHLLPITYPEGIYKLTKKSLTTVLPIWLERFFISLSYRMVDRVITTKNVGSAVDWISANPIIKRKLLVVKTLPETIPTKTFFDALQKAKEQQNGQSPDGRFKLIYVGRFHPEKSVDDLIKMLAVLKEKNVDAHLTLIGDGSERDSLERLSHQLNLSQQVEFLGWRTNGGLPGYFLNSDAFVSALTGGSLREAALCGLPVVAYNADWVEGFLKDEETFLAVKPGDYKEMADKVMRLINDEALRRRLAESLRSLAWNLWSDIDLEKALDEIYGSALHD